MRYSFLWLAAVVASLSTYAEDTGEVRRPIKQSEDPSYEPAPSAGRGRGYRAPKAASQEKKPVVERNEPVQADGQISINTAPVEIQQPAGPKVKYIIDGRPVYEGEAPIAGIDDKKSSSSRAVKETPVSPAASNISASVEIVADTGPKVKYILDGKPIYEGEPPAVSPGPNEVLVQANGRQAASVIEDDLTADKPGTAAAAARNSIILEEMLPAGQVSSRAKKCFKLLGELKANVETIARCLDNRGKENARLIHAGDEAAKNITDMAYIWPNNVEFVNRCALDKRFCLLLNEELSQTPWKWAQVRWSFDAFLKDVTVFREEARDLALAEPAPRPVVLKDGRVIYEDAPDPLIDQLTAARQAQQRIERDTLTRLKNTKEATDSAKKNKFSTDLDGH